MSSMLMILLIEAAVVLLGIVGLLLFLRGKRKKDKSTELGRLLDNFNSLESDRRSKLSVFFMEKQALEKEDAEESVGYLLEAEKQFLQTFLKQQVEETSTENFYQDLTELLDQYLYFIPSKNEQETSDDDSNEVAHNTEKEADIDLGEIQALVLESSKPDQEGLNPDEVEPEENNDKEDAEAVQIEKDAIPEEIQLDNIEEAGEKNLDPDPDWGEAFAESGDTVDEETKANFDTEENKVDSNE